VKTIPIKVSIEDLEDSGSLKEPLVLTVDGYNFKDDEQLANKLFEQLLKNWSVRFDFDQALLNENDSVLIKELLGSYETFLGSKETEAGISFLGKIY
jgi:hypothetical protein